MKLWSWLELRSKGCRLVKWPTVAGIGPVNLLAMIDKKVKFFQFPISYGIDPMNLLKPRFVKRNRVERIGPPTVL